MVHQPVPLLSAAGFDLSSTSSSTLSSSSNPSTDSKAFASDSHYFPPSPISESGSKPVADHSGNFDQGYHATHQRRQSHESHMEERGLQRQNGLHIDFPEADAYKRMEEIIQLLTIVLPSSSRYL